MASARCQEEIVRGSDLKRRGIVVTEQVKRGRTEMQAVKRIRTQKD
jgi:hypothetical protein